MSGRPIVVTGRHRPHEVAFLALSAITGAAFTSGVKPPTSVEMLMPRWVLWTWYLLLLASGIIGLASFTLADPYRALVLERAAMWGQTAAPALYGLALSAAWGRVALFTIAFFFAWTVASGVRLWQIESDIRALRQGGR